MSSSEAACPNALLSALPAEDFRRIEPELSRSELSSGQVLLGQQIIPIYVYFPTTALISVLCTSASGESMDVAITGADGVVGGFTVPAQWASGSAVVQRRGGALRLPASVLRQEFARGGALQRQVLLYTQLLMTQMAQTALCNRLHRLDQQLCRWILMSMDRCGSDRLEITQQQLATMLGVRREGVSAAARRLQNAGLVYWGRGRLRVLDRGGLEAQSCECYEAVRTAAHRLFDFRPPSA
jgi:CRP-like cAMP-binding protein